MNIVFVNGSPRPHGNTGTMLRTLANKAKERGAEVAYLEIADKDIQDCDGCYRCDVEDRCSKEDDMVEVYDLIQRADFLIIGSPIYMGAETGVTKCFIDRLYFLMAKNRLGPGKKAAAFFNCGLIEGHMIYAYMRTRYDKLLHKDLCFDDARTYIVSGAKNSVNVEDNYYAQETLKEMERFIFSEDRDDR